VTSTEPVELNPFNRKVSVDNKTKIHFPFSHNPSVGRYYTQSVGNSSIVKFVEIVMDKAQVDDGRTGGSDESGKFVFQAVASGETTLVITEMFRGSTENELEYTVTVN